MPLPDAQRLEAWRIWATATFGLTGDPGESDEDMRLYIMQDLEHRVLRALSAAAPRYEAKS